MNLAAGILIGIAISAVWNLVLRLIVRANPGVIQPGETTPTVTIGPFLRRKDSGKRKPKSHTDEEIWAIENRDKHV